MFNLWTDMGREMAKDFDPAAMAQIASAAKIYGETLTNQVKDCLEMGDRAGAKAHQKDADVFLLLAAYARAVAKAAS